MTTTPIDWLGVHNAAHDLARRWQPDDEGRSPGVTSVHGVPAGGTAPALIVAAALGVPVVEFEHAERTTLIVDDLVDSGATLGRYVDAGHPYVDALFRKPTSPPDIAPHAAELGGWLTFPWEQRPLGTQAAQGPADAVVRLLEWVGEDPHRDGLKATPDRVCRALREMTAGYHDDPEAILATRFAAHHDQMVVCSGIEFASLCEHHLLPFTGTATVGYVPNGDGVVGLSKLARLVEAFARRLQVQERMTDAIADALEQHLRPQGVGVLVSAHHACMGCRGVRKPTAVMTTCALRGILLHGDAARAEFMAHHHNRG